MPKFNFTSQEILENTFIYPDEFVISMTFKNTGSTVVYVNNLPLLPSPSPGIAGESVSISANSSGEFFSGNISIVFQGGAGKLLAIQQFYLKESL